MLASSEAHFYEQVFICLVQVQDAVWQYMAHVERQTHRRSQRNLEGDYKALESIAALIIF